jgi:hypothetical protein
MITLWSGKIEKGWIGIHVINGVIHRRTRFRIKTATVPRQQCQKACWHFLRCYYCNNAIKHIGILYDHRYIRKRTDTIVAFTQEFCKVSISMGNEKCCEPKLVRLGDMLTKDRKAGVDFK